MLRAGQPFASRVRLLTAAGAPVAAIADKAAFLAASWAILYAVDGIAVPAPDWDFVVVDDALGEYEIHLVVERGDGYLTVLAPGTHEAWPRTRPILGRLYDDDAVAALITSAAGTNFNAERAVSYVFGVKEGDSFLDLVTFPVQALADFGYVDFAADTDGDWSFSAACRTKENRIADNPDFALRAVLYDAAQRLVAIGYNPFPSGAALSSSDATQESKTFLLDVQAQKWKGWAITAIDQGTKQITIAGNQLRFLGVTFPFPVQIVGSTGNDATYSVTAIDLIGGTTVLTVTQDIADATADGRLQVRITLSPIDGQLTVRRQEVRP